MIYIPVYLLGPLKLSTKALPHSAGLPRSGEGLSRTEVVLASSPWILPLLSGPGSTSSVPQGDRLESVGRLLYCL